MKYYLLGLFGLALMVYACSSDELKNPLDGELEKAILRASPTGQIDHFILPDPTDYSSIPQEPNNPITEVKVQLGRMLFFETGLGLDPVHEEMKGTYSCSTCHIPEAGFMPGNAQGIADGGSGFGTNGAGRVKMFYYGDDEPDVQGARALSVLNVAFTPNTTWSGAFGANDNNVGTEDVWDAPPVNINQLGLMGLESQAIEGFALHRMIINAEVIDTLGYKPYFDAAFSEYPESERYTTLTGSFAISAYLRTLISNKAPFQDYLKGQHDALSEQEKRGGLLFFGKAGCYKCHNGKPLNNPDHFYAIGVKDLYECATAINTGVDAIRNFGRGGFTRKEEDMFKFKVPQLYNMKDTPFLFHGSSKHSLEEVVDYFDTAVPENSRVPASQIAAHFKPLGLTAEEKADLVAFLGNALYDHDMYRFVPEQILSGNCFPNNDPLSQQELGCN
ncbi:MAG: cytochrome-c peroxidase [Saprospiraceae bacterium]